jgi:hypothetical protein
VRSSMSAAGLRSPATSRMVKKASASKKPEKIEVFFSYCHRDERLRNSLEKHLAMLKRDGKIAAWHDRKITPGAEIDHVIDKRLESAKLILLLVSSDFLSSDYCYGREMQRALERHREGTARVIPIILRPTMWHDAPFGKLLALPRDGKPVTKWATQDEALLDIVIGIKAAIDRMS